MHPRVCVPFPVCCCIHPFNPGETAGEIQRIPKSDGSCDFLDREKFRREQQAGSLHSTNQQLSGGTIAEVLRTHPGEMLVGPSDMSCYIRDTDLLF